jgi:hypothetical protein
MAHNGQQTELDRLIEVYKEQARQILMILAMTLTTGKLSTMGEHFLVAPAMATFRALCLGLIRLRLQKSTDESTGIPFTRVDPAVIEEALSKLTPREFLKLPFFNMEDVVLIIVKAEGQKKYIFATRTGDGADVNFREIDRSIARYYVLRLDYNIKCIGNSTYYSPED